MRITCGLVIAFAAVTSGGLARPFFAQGTSDGSQPLVGTWQLTRLERTTDTQPSAQVPNPVGMLIQDASGHVIEIVSRAARPASLDCGGAVHDLPGLLGVVHRRFEQIGGNVSDRPAIWIPAASDAGSCGHLSARERSSCSPKGRRRDVH